MPELPEIVGRAATVHDAIADDLSGFGGILRCNVCKREQPVGDIAGNLRRGWPECCGYTMTWVTRRELAREGREVPEGFELAAVPDPDWRTENGGQCRRRLAGRRSCPAPAVAALNRGYTGRSNWWRYCADHLYGRWIEDGQVMTWILREKKDDA